jgi:hypothetical protein
MEIAHFDEVLEDRLKKIRLSLLIKGKEYRRNNDPLHNFNRGAELSGQSREKVLWGFALKHHVSFLDMLDDIDMGKFPKIETVDEKIGDLINYLILCEASIKDKIRENTKEDDGDLS